MIRYQHINNDLILYLNTISQYYITSRRLWHWRVFFVWLVQQKQQEGKINYLTNTWTCCQRDIVCCVRNKIVDNERGLTDVWNLKAQKRWNSDDVRLKNSVRICWGHPRHPHWSWTQQSHRRRLNSSWSLWKHMLHLFNKTTMTIKLLMKKLIN